MMAEISKPNWLRFLEAVKENMDDDENKKMFTINKVKASEFYQSYVNWCKSNGERHIMSANKFGMMIKNFIEKSKTKSGWYYNVTTITFN